MTSDLVATVFSDGWTDMNHHPIVNIIMGVHDGMVRSVLVVR
jgi:hypothetical protein